MTQECTGPWWGLQHSLFLFLGLFLRESFYFVTLSLSYDVTILLHFKGISAHVRCLFYSKESQRGCSLQAARLRFTSNKISSYETKLHIKSRHATSSRSQSARPCSGEIAYAKSIGQDSEGPFVFQTYMGHAWDYDKDQYPIG